MEQLLLRHEKVWLLILEGFNYLKPGNTKVVWWVRDSSTGPQTHLEVHMRLIILSEVTFTKKTLFNLGCTRY